MRKQVTVFVFTFIIFVSASFAVYGAPGSEVNRNARAEHTPSRHVIDAIMDSYSGRSFKEGTVPDAAIEILLNAAQKAPSAGNAQPWHFTVIRNAGIARQVAPRHYAEGALVIVISGRPDPRRPGIEIFDSASASQNIYLAAQALGFGVRQYITGVQEVNNNMRGSLGIPDGYNAIIIMMIGHSADETDAVSSASPRRPIESNTNFIE